MRDYLKETAMLVRAAQLASDEAKCHENRRKFKERYLRGAFYERKDDAIKKAIDIIVKKHPKGMHFSVMPCDEGNTPYIIYFCYTMEDGTRLQVSFHTIYYSYGKYCNKKSNTRWDEGSSLRQSRTLAEYFGVEDSARDFAYGSVTKNAKKESYKVEL